MKKVIIIALALLFTISSYSQDSPLLKDGDLNVDSFYQDKEEKLIYSAVAKFDSLTKSQLMTKVKDWAGTNFRSLRDVLKSETDDQLVLVYINKSYFTKGFGIKTAAPWYIRLVIQFKDGKIKCSYYDDGVAPNGVIGSRSFDFGSYFKKDDVGMIARNNNRDGMIAIHDDLVLSFELLKKALSSATPKAKDW